MSPLRTLLPSIRQALSRTEIAGIAVYVMLSLGSALAGSIAAILLVPLVQPGQPISLAGGLLRMRGSVDEQAIGFGVAMIGFALLRWFAARLGSRLTARYATALRLLVHSRLVDASVAPVSYAPSAEIASVLTHNGEVLTQGFSAILQLLVISVTSAVSLAFAFYVSPLLMLAAPFVMAFCLFISRLFGREQSRVSRQYIADLTSLFWHSEDFPRRLRHVRSFQREQAEKASYGEISDRLGRGYGRQLELVASGRLMLELLAALGVAGMFVLSSHWHGVERSALITVGLLLGRLLPFVVSTQQSVQQLRSAAPAFELWQRYMQLEPAHTTPARAPLARAETICIDYLRITPPFPSLEVAQFFLVPGELTLVAGDSGIGKSSLADVLSGMIAPVAFTACADGRPMDFDAYRERVRHGAYVSQNMRPWQRTVRDCLRWAAPEASEAQMHEALADVGLTRRLSASPDGLDTSLNSAGNRFSGGELQRLLLAQVLLRRPTLAVLDEATSALDAPSELAVLSVMRRRLRGTILLVVSHRGSVEGIADQCLSIDNELRATIRASRSLAVGAD